MKVYNGVSPDEFDAIVDEAGKVGLSVIGHGERSVGLPAYLFLGEVMVAHAEEFYYTAFANRSDVSRPASVVADTLPLGRLRHGEPQHPGCHCAAVGQARSA